MSAIVVKIAVTLAWMVPWVVLAVFARKRARQGIEDLAWVMGGISALMLIWMMIALVVRWSQTVLAA